MNRFTKWTAVLMVTMMSLWITVQAQTPIPITPQPFWQTDAGSWAAGSYAVYEFYADNAGVYNFSVCINDGVGGDCSGDGDFTLYSDAALTTMVWYIDGPSSCGYDATTLGSAFQNWQPTTSGTYYLKVDDYYGDAATYTLAFQGGVWWYITPTTTCQVENAGGFPTGDGHWFEMYLYSTETYNFSICNLDPCAGDYSGSCDGDFWMYDATGTNNLWYIDGSSTCNYNASTYGTSYQDWAPPSDGTYLLYVNDYCGGDATVVDLAYIMGGGGGGCEPIPYSQNFDASTLWPVGWSEGGDLAVWEISTTWPGTTPPTGNHVYSDYYPYTQGFVYSPCFDGTGKTNLHVRFFHYWRADYSSGTQDGYFYGSPDGGTTPILLDEWHHNAPATEEGWKTYDISSWADGATDIVFWWDVTHGDDWYWVWDDFQIQEGPWSNPGSWIGLVNTDWNEPGNWDGGIIPDMAIDVTIPAGCPFYPVINTYAECQNMDILAGGAASVDATGDLHSFGDLTNYGTYSLNGGNCDIFGVYNSESGSITNIMSGTFSIGAWTALGFWANGVVNLMGGDIYCYGYALFGYADVNHGGPFNFHVYGDALRLWNTPMTNYPPTAGNWFVESSSTDFYLYSSAFGTGNYLPVWNLTINSPITEVHMNPDGDVTGFAVFNNLEILNGNCSTVFNTGENDDFFVNGDFSVGPDQGANFTTNAAPVYIGGDLNVLAGPTGYGSWIDNGNVTVAKGVQQAQVYYDGTKWHMISSPVANAVSGMYLGLYLQGHDETTNLWTDIIPMNIPLNVGQGYALWNQTGGGHVAPYMGQFNTGNYSMALTRNNLGWNAVGNPYPSSIDWNATGWTKTNIADATYIENAGNWATYIAGVGANGGSQYIAPGQGFFVECLGGGGSIGWSNAIRTHNATPFFKDAVANMVRLEASGNGRTDETVVRFLNEATAGFDNSFDARKMFAYYDEFPQVYSLDNGYMSINTLPVTDQVALGFTAGMSGTYTLAATGINDLSYVMLEDLVTGTMTNLLSNSYTFDYTAGSNEARFILHFAPLAVPELDAEAISIYAVDRDVYVNVPENTDGHIMVFNTLGQQVTTAPINNTLNKVTVNKPGSYIVRVLSDNRTITGKVMIK
ncbi:MAG: T9SS type A sorting domain-containing protein [Bacteroidales bacterium]|nr:T9SS type A sorting domain-containing protein [Bacteroidales bacterium]